MAFSHVGSIAIANAKVAGATLVATVTADIPVDALVVVFVAWNNNNAGTPDNGTPVSDQHSVIDSQGNVYTTLSSGQNRGPGTQNAGTHGSMHACHLTTALANGDTITARLNTGNNLVAKAMAVEEFAYDSSKRWARRDENHVLTTAADPGAVTLSGMESREYLLLHVLACEGPDTDAYTWDADYTEITGTGTTGGADDSNQQVRGGFRIATLTGDTVDVQSDTADRDYWQGLVALFEADYDSVFPAEDLLDDFTRANEGPLDNGTWRTSSYAHGGSPWLELNSNVVKAKTGTSQYCGQWWEEMQTDTDAEAWVTVTTEPTGASDGSLVAINSGGTQATLAGDCVAWRKPASAIGPDELQNAQFLATSSGGPIAIGVQTRSWRDGTVGAKYGVQRRGNVVHTWLNDTGAWRWISAYWWTDFALGRLFLGCRDQQVRVDDFGGGPFTVTRHLLPILLVGA